MSRLPRIAAGELVPGDFVRQGSARHGGYSWHEVVGLSFGAASVYVELAGHGRIRPRLTGELVAVKARERHALIPDDEVVIGADGSAS